MKFKYKKYDYSNIIKKPEIKLNFMKDFVLVDSYYISDNNTIVLNYRVDSGIESVTIELNSLIKNE